MFSPSRIWDRLPFAGRLLITASVALIVAGLAMLYTSAVEDAGHAKADLRAELEGEQTGLPLAISELLIIGDFASLQQTLDRRVKRANVSHIRYQDASGAVIESRDPRQDSNVPEWFVKWFGLTDLTGEAAVTVGGRTYGTLLISISAQKQINRTWAALVHHLSVLLLAIMLDFAGIWMVLRGGLKPLRALDAGARALGHGDFTVRIPLQGGPELRRSIASFNRMAQSLEQLVEEVRTGQACLRESEQRLDSLPSMTGSPVCRTGYSPQTG